jgi:protein-L-isoaspartate(D-aspartate) O-methyltransferase
MASSADTQQERRLAMVNCQLRTSDVPDQEVLAAFLEVPRERFVSAAFVDLAYLDCAAPALGARTRRLLPPATLARMIQAAAVNRGDLTLYVGGGSGYGAALLHAMGAKVVALESDPGAAKAAGAALAGAGIEFVEAPLEAGAPKLAPFDVIVIEGAFRVFPNALIAQLADGGRLVGIDAIMGAPQAALYERKGGAVSRRALFEAAADTLDGFQPEASFVF